MSAPAQGPRSSATPAADSTTTSSSTAPPAPLPLQDASADQPRLPDDGAAILIGDFERLVREPVRVGHDPRGEAELHATGISRDSLNLYLRALKTLVTHVVDGVPCFRRRPDDVWSEFEASRRKGYRYQQCAVAFGHLQTRPSGTRGVVLYRLVSDSIRAASSANSWHASPRAVPTVGTARVSLPLLPPPLKERPEPNPQQRQFAADLGVDPTGMDGVELFDVIEAASAARTARRAAKRAERAGGTDRERPRCLCNLPAGGRCQLIHGHLGPCAALEDDR